MKNFLEESMKNSQVDITWFVMGKQTSQAKMVYQHTEKANKQGR